MPNHLPISANQARDLQQLVGLCRRRRAQLVLIGAVALAAQFPLQRPTLDIDLTVALDFPEFEVLIQALRDLGWKQAQNLEHRWLAPKGTVLDIVPAGPRSLAARCLIWPVSGFQMSLTGFHLVFRHHRPFQLPGGKPVDVVTAPVLALLKMAAYLDRPAQRRKDMDDLRRMLDGYERGSDRTFSDEVLAANLSDVQWVPSFLLGSDLRRICAVDDRALVAAWLAAVAPETPGWWAFRGDSPFTEERESQAVATLAAFTQGFAPGGDLGTLPTELDAHRDNHGAG